MRRPKTVPTIPVFFLAFALVVLVGPAFAQDAASNAPAPLRADQARANEGQNVTIEGMAAGTHRDEHFGTYLDIDSQGPTPVFAGFIPKDNEQQFPGIESLKGHVVAITGVVRMRDGYPIIQMMDAGQLRVVH